MCFIPFSPHSSVHTSSRGEGTTTTWFNSVCLIAQLPAFFRFLPVPHFPLPLPLHLNSVFSFFPSLLSILTGPTRLLLFLLNTTSMFIHHINSLATLHHLLLACLPLDEDHCSQWRHLLSMTSSSFQVGSAVKPGSHSTLRPHDCFQVGTVMTRYVFSPLFMSTLANMNVPVDSHLPYLPSRPRPMAPQLLSRTPAQATNPHSPRWQSKTSILVVA